MQDSSQFTEGILEEGEKKILKNSERQKYSGKKERENFSLVNLHNKRLFRFQDSFTSSFDEMDKEHVKSRLKSSGDGDVDESFLRFSQACKNFYEDNQTTVPSSNYNPPNFDYFHRITPLKKANCFENRKFSLTKFSKNVSGFKNRLSLFKNFTTGKKKDKKIMTAYQKLIEGNELISGKKSREIRRERKQGKKIVFRSLEKLKLRNKRKEADFRPVSYTRKKKGRKLGKRRNAKKEILKIKSSDFMFKDENEKPRKSDAVRKSLKKLEICGRKFRKRDRDFERALEKSSMKKKISLFETLIDRKSVTPRKMRMR